MENLFGLKELYDVKIKATYDIENGGKTIKKGEIVALFDRVQIANFSEFKEIVSARGGYGNTAHVTWETSKELYLQFTQGIFSQTQFALMNNSKLLSEAEVEPLEITKREELESDDNGQVTLTYAPSGNIFVYEKSTGDKLTYTVNGKILTLPKKYTDVIVDYTYKYTGFSVVRIGHEFTQGYLELEGRSRIKDDDSGETKTAIIKIPKLKLSSTLMLSLGKNASPQMGNFSATAYPEGIRHNSKIADIYFLDEDIDLD